MITVLTPLTREELREAIAYHRRTHRPHLLAAKPGSIQDCQLPTCQILREKVRRAREDEDRRREVQPWHA